MEDQASRLSKWLDGSIVVVHILMEKIRTHKQKIAEFGFAREFFQTTARILQN